MARFSRDGTYGVDVETTGLKPFHGDRLFSIILADSEGAVYLNFQEYESLDGEYILDRGLLPLLKPVFGNPRSTFAAHNAKFDLHMLSNEGLEIAGTVHCTKSAALLEYNQSSGYSLAACLKRIGLEKDDAVDAYFKTHPELTTKVAVAGKKQRKTLKDFTRVPPEIIVAYGLRDAEGTLALHDHQLKAIEKLDAELPIALPRIGSVLGNERRLTKTILRMERLGLRVDRDFCSRAASFEQARSDRAAYEFKTLTGKDYAASPKLWAEVFQDQKEKWQYTDKGNASFESEILESFESPVAEAVLTLRNAKAKSDFYTAFSYHADTNGDIHPHLNQDGAAHGRFSSSEPNMQNMSKEKAEVSLEDAIGEFTVRRAIVPRPGFFFVAIDYKAAEYRLALDVSGEMGVIEKVRGGLDVHQVIADLAGIERDPAKNINFGLLYGQGVGLLSKSLKTTMAKAKALRELVLEAVPKINEYNQGIMQTAKKRGWIFNWFGRRCWFPDSNYAYTALNHAMSGGCADFVKIGMNKLDDFLLDKKSRMIWNVHDENLFEVAYGEEHIIPELKRIMEEAYPHRHLRMECDVSWSDKSFAKADLKKWEGTTNGNTA